MAFAYPSGSNTYVPSFDATGNLVVAFSRNPSKFKLNKYATLVPVKKSTGYYMRMTAEEAGRIVSSDALREFVWHDGSDRPDPTWGTESHSWYPYTTTRYDYGFRVGYKASEQADFRLIQVHSEFKAQQAMTGRTFMVLSKATDSANYDAAQVKTATQWGGGFWSAGTATNPIIKKSLNAMAQAVQKATVGAVDPADMVLVISPDLADPMSRSEEIHTYLKESPFALAQIRGDSPSQNGQWGLPDQLYGYKIVVEDAVKVTNRKGATRAASYMLSSNSAFFVARPGGLVSMAGGPNFSSLHIFAYEEMTVETRDNPDHRRTEGHVVDDFGVEFVAPATACLVTNALS